MEVAKIPLKKVKLMKRQPRQYFNEERLEQLAGSIKEVGQLQPIIVKRDGPDYLLIAGERRYRAVKKNQQTEIAAVIMNDGVDESTLGQIQLIENLQREDLNPLERAVSINRFIEENGLTKKDAAEKLGVPRTTLTEWLNILDVPEKYQQAVVDEDSALSLSHISLAHALVSRTGDPTKLKQLLDGVLKYKLSRSETKDITELFYKYLHLSMEEALGVVLLRREHQRVVDSVKKNPRGKKKPVRDLINSLTRLGKKAEEVMEGVGVLEEEEKEDLVDEFLYLYQLVGLLVPGFSKGDLDKMVDDIKELKSRTS